MSAQIRFKIAAIVRNTSSFLSRSNTAKSKAFVPTRQETKQPQENNNGGGASAFVINEVT
jgi:hypothetical protein